MLRNKITDELQQKWKNAFPSTISIYFRAGKRENKKGKGKRKKILLMIRKWYISVAFTLQEENKRSGRRWEGKIKEEIYFTKNFDFLLFNFPEFPFFFATCSLSIRITGKKYRKRTFQCLQSSIYLRNYFISLVFCCCSPPLSLRILQEFISIRAKSTFSSWFISSSPSRYRFTNSSAYMRKNFHSCFYSFSFFIFPHTRFSHRWNYLEGFIEEKVTLWWFRLKTEHSPIM